MANLKYKINFIVLMSFLLGIIIVVQLKSVNGAFGFVTVKSISEISDQITVEKNEIENLEILIKQKQNKLDLYNEQVGQNGSITPVLLQEKEKAMLYSQTAAVTGEGIIVRLEDGERELKENENPNNLIIHDADVLHIVNDLKIAGAESIAINGQRLSSLSEMKCSGPTITINNKTYGQPFEIHAIGPAEKLEKSIMDKDTYGYILKNVYSLGVSVYKKQQIYIPAYQTDLEFNYLKEAK